MARSNRSKSSYLGLSKAHEILKVAFKHAKAKLEYTSLAMQLCAETFTIHESRAVYEAVWGLALDPANFHPPLLRSA
jgi:hypothetical protein